MKNKTPLLTGLFSIITIVISSMTLAGPSLDVCDDAVSNGKSFIEAQQKIALQRKSAENIGEEDFQRLIQELSEPLKWITLENCMTSSGEQEALFQCLKDKSGNTKLCKK